MQLVQVCCSNPLRLEWCRQQTAPRQIHGAHMAHLSTSIASFTVACSFFCNTIERVRSVSFVRARATRFFAQLWRACLGYHRMQTESSCQGQFKPRATSKETYSKAWSKKRIFAHESVEEPSLSSAFFAMSRSSSPLSR